MALSALSFHFDDQHLGESIRRWLEMSQARLMLYWDQFAKRPLPQYIECDFDYVAAALSACVEQRLIDGNLFVEWGCGFGVVTGVASLLGMEAVGIEAEDFLCCEARELLSQGGIPAEIWHGNFLPNGASRLAIDEDPLVSLTHNIESAYVRYDMQLEDFALVFAYPWPGEEHFLKLVFDRYARPNATLLMYRGPYHVELYRKK